MDLKIQEVILETAHLRHFVQIVDRGSIVGAAQHLGLSRSVLRRSLSTLEEEVGVPLLHRDALGVRLTAAGAVVLEHGRLMLEGERALLTDARAAETDVVGVLRVIQPVGLPLAMHVKILLATHQTLPRQRLVVRHVEDPASCLHEPFEVMLHEGAAPATGTWFSRVIVRTALRLAASAEYLERRGTPTCIEDLSGHDTLGWNRPGQPAGEWPLRAGGKLHFQPWFSSTDPHLLTALAMQGGGIFLAPRMPFFDDPDVEPLVPVLEDQVGEELTFRVTTPFASRADARTRSTLQLLHQHLEALPLD